MPPNPLPLYKVVLPDDIESTKKIYCAHYDQCLMKLAKRGCIQWTCQECSAFTLMSKQQWKADVSCFIELAATVIESEDFDLEDEDEDIDALEAEPVRKTPFLRQTITPTEQPPVSSTHVAGLPREERLVIAIDLVKQGWPTKRAGKHTNTASTTIRRACKKLGIQFNLGKPPGKEAKLRTKTAMAIELIERGHSVEDAASAIKTGAQTVVNALEKYKASLDTNLYGL